LHVPAKEHNACTGPWPSRRWPAPTFVPCSTSTRPTCPRSRQTAQTTPNVLWARGSATTKCTPVPAAPAKSPRLGGAIGRVSPPYGAGGGGGSPTEGAPRARRRPAGEAPPGDGGNHARRKRLKAGRVAERRGERSDSTSGGADAWRVLGVGEPSLGDAPGRAGRGSPARRGGATT